MSRICGWVDFSGAPAAAETLRAMASAAAPRGSESIHYGGGREVALAYVELDRTPEAAGVPQPISSPDGAVHLCADARLDNRKELLPILRSAIGKPVPADAELILAAYLHWGTDCVEHLLGDFAFVVWDARSRQLFCARDPLGVKPLHYCRVGDVFAVASEAQQILRHPAVSSRLDKHTIGEFLGDVFHTSDRTFFRSVKRLMPAHRLVASAAAIRIERFWDVDPERRLRYRRDEEYAEHFRQLFNDAVAARLRTRDAAVGVSMSGGLDSTSVTATAARLLAAAGSPRLVAASYVFEQLRDCDESPHMRTMVDELGIDVEYIEAERYWIFGDPAAYEPYPETPLVSWDGVYRQVFDRLRQRGARVLLGGLGGDNLYMGSPRAYVDRWRRGEIRVVTEILRHAWRLRGRPLSGAFRQYLYRPIMTRIRAGLQRNEGTSIPSWITPTLRRRVEQSEVEPIPRRFEELARQERYENIVGLTLDGRATDWLDRCAGRWGFEVRHPHLDLRLVELVLSIPSQQFYCPGWYKPLLRRAMAGVLPETVRHQTGKSHLENFLHWSLRVKEGDRIERILKEPLSAEMGLVDGVRLRDAFRDYRRDGRLECDLAKLWFAIELELWLRRFHRQFEVD